MKQQQPGKDQIRFPYFAWLFVVPILLYAFLFVMDRNYYYYWEYNLTHTIVACVTSCVAYGVIVVFLCQKKRTLAYIIPFSVLACNEIPFFVPRIWGILTHLNRLINIRIHDFISPFLMLIKTLCWIGMILLVYFAFRKKAPEAKKISSAFYIIPLAYGGAVLIDFLSAFMFSTDFFTDFFEFLADLLLVPGLSFMIYWILHPENIFTEDAVELTHMRSSVFANILLLLMTCGIWQYVWVMRITAFTNYAKGENRRNPLTKLLLYMFVPFYYIYWIYKSANRIDKMAKERELTSDISGICLFLSFFLPLISFILMQDKLNRIAVAPVPVSIPAPADTPETAKTKVNPSLDELIQLKQLLDMGAINQDEYNIKKKQILGLDDPKP